MIEKILEILNKYENILILGFGREWKTSYNFIRKHLPNKHLTILDENQIWEIDDENTDIIIGKITIERLRQFDLIVSLIVCIHHFMCTGVAAVITYRGVFYQMILFY